GGHLAPDQALRVPPGWRSAGFWDFGEKIQASDNLASTLFFLLFTGQHEPSLPSGAACARKLLPAVRLASEPETGWQERQIARVGSDRQHQHSSFARVSDIQTTLKLWMPRVKK